MPAYGGAGVGVHADIFTAQSNPAGLAELDRYEIGFERNSLPLDLSSNFASLGGTFRADILRRLSWAVSYADLDYGQLRLTTVTDPTGSAGSVIEGGDRMGSIGLGLNLGSENQLKIGGAVKFFRLDVAGYRADGVAGDIGVLVTPSRWPIRFGASLQNFGADAVFITSQNPLPLTGRAGLAYNGRIVGAPFELAFDVITGKAEEPHISVGGGLTILDHVVLRAGYDGAKELDRAPSAGLGLMWDDLRLDYVYLPFGEAGSSNRFSLHYIFGTPRAEPKPAVAAAARVAPAETFRPVVMVPQPEPDRSVTAVAMPELPPTVTSPEPAWTPAPYWASAPPSEASTATATLRLVSSSEISLYLPPTRPDQRESWKAIFVALNASSMVRLVSKREALYELDLSALMKTAEGNWIGPVMLQDPSGTMIAMLVVPSPGRSTDDLAQHVTSWFLDSARK
ncbi:MAG: hypothetical protein AAB229_10970 [Candidatus Hydrogenedentota bacterium]